MNLGTSSSDVCVLALSFEPYFHFHQNPISCLDISVMQSPEANVVSSLPLLFPSLTRFESACFRGCLFILGYQRKYTLGS